MFCSIQLQCVKYSLTDEMSSLSAGSILKCKIETHGKGKYLKIAVRLFSVRSEILISKNDAEEGNELVENSTFS